MSESDNVPPEMPAIPGWLAELAVIPGEFPMEDMRQAWQRGDEIEGVLADYLRWLARPDQPGREIPDDDWLHFIGFALLSDRGCPDLFDPLVAISSDEEYADLLLGDAMTEDLTGWLRACGKERTDDLRRITEDGGRCVWLRLAALQALGGLAWEEDIPRESHQDYLRRLPDLLPREGDAVWSEWWSQVAYFGMEDLLDRVKAAEEADFLGIHEGAESVLEMMRSPARVEYAERNFFHKRPGGTAGLEDLAKFLCFEPGYYEAIAESQAREEAERLRREVEWEKIAAGMASRVPHQPVVQLVREEPKVGRNDPCPCGSGKKSKKCCG